MRQQLDKLAACLLGITSGAALHSSATAIKHAHRDYASPSANCIAVMSLYNVKLLPLFGQQPTLHIQGLGHPLPSWLTSPLRRLRKAAERWALPELQDNYSCGCWCDAGECIVLVNWENEASLLRVSTYRVHGAACHLLGTWVTDRAHLTGTVDLHVTAGAAEIYLVLPSGDSVLFDINVETSVLLCSPTGIISSHSVLGRLSWHYASGSGLIGLTFSALHLFFPAGMRSVDLGQLLPLFSDQSNPEPDDETARLAWALNFCANGSWGNLAVAWRLSYRHTGQHQQLLLVELTSGQNLQLQHSESMHHPVDLWNFRRPLHISVGRCSVALAETSGHVVRVRATAGPRTGVELFCINAAHPSFEPVSGLFLAVATLAGGLSVLHGVTGIQMASWPAPGPSRPIRGAGVGVRLHWLPDASGVLMTLSHFPKWGCTKYRTIMF